MPTHPGRLLCSCPHIQDLATDLVTMALLSSLHLAPLDWMIAALCAILVGFSKTGIVGLGILVVPLMAMIFPAQQSPGILLPMLIMADVVAVGYYHRHAVWKHLIRMMPWAVAGILAAFALLKTIPWDDAAYAKLLGFIILGCIASVLWRTGADRSRHNGDAGSNLGVHGKAFASFMGLVGGVATMLANAAGSIWSIYFLAIGLPKYAFIGTGAWFYLILNCFKVPFQANLGNITSASVAFNFLMLPLILVGGVIGIWALPRINQKLFNRLVLILAALAGLRLIW